MLQEYVRNVLAVLVLCCNKCFHVASCKCFYLNVAYVSHTCCKCMFLNVSSALDLCCTQVFYVVSVSCFRGVFRESLGARPGTEGKRVAAIRGPTNGARCTPRVL
jgi:hypothetical protein